MSQAFIDAVMQHWRAGKNTWSISVIMVRPEHVVAKALRIGRDAERRTRVTHAASDGACLPV
ncbi:hypothetical protein [Tardiphaga sp.]|jgi:hypothetical protein|uniref:hypothetical protein n=1 Tax=Tardiphaga sp. TaxID=1926292 RepID=UPI0037DA211A